MWRSVLGFSSVTAFNHLDIQFRNWTHTFPSTYSFLYLSALGWWQYPSMKWPDIGPKLHPWILTAANLQIQPVSLLSVFRLSFYRFPAPCYLCFLWVVMSNLSTYLPLGWRQHTVSVPFTVAFPWTQNDFFFISFADPSHKLLCSL